MKVEKFQGTLYIGLVEGKSRMCLDYWNGGEDSVLYGEIDVIEYYIVDLQNSLIVDKENLNVLAIQKQCHIDVSEENAKRTFEEAERKYYKG